MNLISLMVTNKFMYCAKLCVKNSLLKINKICGLASLRSATPRVPVSSVVENRYFASIG